MMEEPEITKLSTELEVLREKNKSLQETLDRVSVEQQRLRAIIDNVPAPVYMKDVDGAYILINRCYERLSGVSREALLGKKDSDFYSQEIAELFRGQDKEVIRQGRPLEFEESVTLESGTATFITQKFPMRNDAGEIYAVGGFCTDISERKAIERDLQQSRETLVRQVESRTRALRESQLFFQSIFDQSPYPVLITDERGEAVAQNRACREYWGKADSEILGHYNLFKDRVLEEGGYLSTVREVYNGGRPASFVARYSPDDYEMLCGRRVSEDILISYSVYPVKGSGGRITNAIVQQVDITAKERSAREKEELENQVQQLQKMEAIGTLATGVAHEINQPLSYVKIIFEATLQGLRDGSLDLDELGEDCRESLKQISRITGIINHLREFSRSDSGLSARMPISKIVDNSLILIKERLRLRNITFKAAYSDPCPEVCMDQVKMEQVFINLLQNAMDSLESVSAPRINVVAWVEDESCFIDFTDNGPGVPPEHVSKIFDPFFTTKGVGQGTGLGLSICFEIMQNHGGSITYLADAQDTTFRLVLPMKG